MSETLFDSIDGNTEFGAAAISEDISLSFSTSSGSVVLSDIRLGLYDSTPSDGGSITVVLHADSGTTPGTTIATLGTISDSSLATTISNSDIVNLAITGGPTLAADTRYWITLVDNSSSAGLIAGSAAGTGVSSQYYQATESAPPFFTPETVVSSNSATSTAFFMNLQGDPACFLAGTPIQCPDGPVAIEALRVKDSICLAGGGTARVVWLGYRHVDCRRHKRPWDAWPVRVSADAFGPGAPRHDILLSPDHATLVDGVLIPIRYLTNGVTIRQEEADEATYWHVELDHHDVLLADGLPCETFLDTGNRGAFANTEGPVQLQPDFGRIMWDCASCAPLVMAGAELEAARSLVAEHAAALGYRITHATDLHALAGEHMIAPTRTGTTFRFTLPEGCDDVRLVSPAGVPAHVDIASDDCRAVGIAVEELRIDGNTLALDDPALRDGWHAPEFTEDASWRWTKGAASVAVEGGRVLEVDIAMVQARWEKDERPAAAWREAA